MKKTTTEAELRKWIEQGKTHDEIAGLLGRHTSGVAAACAVLGLTHRRPRAQHASAEQFLEGLRVGMTIREIAEKHNTHHCTVVQTLKRKGLPTSARQWLVAHAKAPQPALPPHP